MALTKISGDVLQTPLNVGVVTASTINVGSAVTIHSGGFTIGSSDLHSTGLIVQNLSSTGVVTATSIVATTTIVAAGSTSAPSISPSGDSNTGIFFPSADTIAFTEGGVEAARINSSGRFLIGTAEDTSTTLNVRGVISSSNSLFTYSTFDGYTDGNLYITSNAGQANTTNSNIIFRNSTSGGTITEYARINSAGRLGIGSAIPQQVLDVNGAIRINGNASNQYWTDIISAYNYGAAFYINVRGGSSSTMQILTASETNGLVLDSSIGGNPLILKTAGTEAARITSDGRLGIGTNNPATTLHTYSTSQASNRFQYHTPTTLSSSTISAEFKTSSNSLSVGARTGFQFVLQEASNSYIGAYIQSVRENASHHQGLSFSTWNGAAATPSERVRINKDGNTGIGTDNPTQKLHVQGDVLTYALRANTDINSQTDTGNIASGTTLSYRNLSGFQSYTAAVTCNNTWYTLFPVFNHTSGFIFVTAGDASSKNIQEWFFDSTSAAYGVALVTQLHSAGSWNTGSFSLQLGSSGNNYTLQAKATSYYSSSNVAGIYMKIISNY